MFNRFLLFCILCLLSVACLELPFESAPTRLPELDVSTVVALQPVTVEFSSATDIPVATPIAIQPAATQGIEIGITPLAVQTATLPPVATAVPPQPTAAPTTDSTIQRFVVDGLSMSSRDLLSNVALTVNSAEFDPIANTLSFSIALTNDSNEPLNLVGSSLPDTDWRLTDANGSSYRAIQIDQQLSRFVPDGGFAPGGANVGRVVFNVPDGPQPYQLAFATAFDFAPMTVRVDTPLSDSKVAVPSGQFAVGLDLYSSQEVLEPLTLRVETVDVSAETVTFNINFVNNQRRGYTIRGVEGGDAWLLDSTSQQASPIAVSESIAATIAPPDGWPAYSEHRGTITFARPTNFASARFIFNGFSPLTLSFDSGGMQSANITSATGGAPPLPPEPSAEDVAYDQIEELLAQQADALLSGNADAWARTFTPASQPFYGDSLRRTGDVPLGKVTVELGNSAELGPTLEQGSISDLDVTLIFEFAEMVENQFRHSASYDLLLGESGWQVSNLAFTNDAPFWWNADLVQQSTEHFLLFATEGGASALSEFEREAEVAWTDLRDQGLPIDDRYLAYYTATQQEFAEQAGGSQLQLGIARSRYQIFNGGLTISNRIFYINGESFADASVAAANDRQVTVTHELVHLVMGKFTRPFSPPWLTEGVAVFYSSDVSAETRLRLLINPAYPSIDLTTLTAANSLGAHDFTGSRASAEYAYAGQLYAYLVEIYGEIATLNFYRSYDDFSGSDLQSRIPSANSGVVLESVMSNIASDLTPQLVQQAFNIPIDQLEREFRAWLEQ